MEKGSMSEALRKMSTSELLDLLSNTRAAYGPDSPGALQIEDVLTKRHGPELLRRIVHGDARCQLDT